MIVILNTQYEASSIYFNLSDGTMGEGSSFLSLQE